MRDRTRRASRNSRRRDPRTARQGAPTANVLAALPKSAHPGAKAALAKICGADDQRHAQIAAKRFADLHGTKAPTHLEPI